MIEIVTTDTLQDKITDGTALEDFSDSLDARFDPIDAVLDHNAAPGDTVHSAAAFIRVKIYSEGEWTLKPNATLWLRFTGDPDPDAEMGEDDVIIDGTV